MQFLESYVLKHVTMLLTGDMAFSSYLDRIGHVDNVYEVRGTYYEHRADEDNIRSYDFTDFVTVARHSGTSRIIYNHAAKDLLDLFTPTTVTDDTRPVSVAPLRKYILLLLFFFLTYLIFSSILVRTHSNGCSNRGYVSSKPITLQHM